jgi:hypothetical protein
LIEKYYSEPFNKIVIKSVAEKVLVDINRKKNYLENLIDKIVFRMFNLTDTNSF